jgi:hypothetical protein
MNRAHHSVLFELAQKCKKIFVKERDKICNKSYERGFRCGFATLLEAFPPKGQKWIAVEEKYPSHSQFVVIKREQLQENQDKCSVSFAWYDCWSERFYQQSPKDTFTKITHWMPIITEDLYVAEIEENWGE